MKMLAKYWKEYWIIGRNSKLPIQIINNWHEWKRDEWHLVSLYRKPRNEGYEYYFALLGFQIRTIRRNPKRVN